MPCRIGCGGSSGISGGRLGMESNCPGHCGAHCDGHGYSWWRGRSYCTSSSKARLLGGSWKDIFLGGGGLGGGGGREASDNELPLSSPPYNSQGAGGGGSESRLSVLWESSGGGGRGKLSRSEPSGSGSRLCTGAYVTEAYVTEAYVTGLSGEEEPPSECIEAGLVTTVVESTAIGFMAMGFMAMGFMAKGFMAMGLIGAGDGTGLAWLGERVQPVYVVCLLSVDELLLLLPMLAPSASAMVDLRRLSRLVRVPPPPFSSSPFSIICLVVLVSGSEGMADGLRLMVPEGKSHSKPPLLRTSASCSVDEDRPPSLRQPLEEEDDAPDDGTQGRAAPGDSRPCRPCSEVTWMEATEQLRALASRSSSSCASSSDSAR